MCSATLVEFQQNASEVYQEYFRKYFPLYHPSLHRAGISTIIKVNISLLHLSILLPVIINLPFSLDILNTCNHCPTRHMSPLFRKCETNHNAMSYDSTIAGLPSSCGHYRGEPLVANHASTGSQSCRLTFDSQTFLTPFYRNLSLS